MPPVHERSLSADNTINVVFGVLAVVLGTLSVITAVITWRSRHAISGGGLHRNNATVIVELQSVQSTPTTMSTVSRNNGDDGEQGARGRTTDHIEH
ncbi:hypothetical protein H2199_003970 [Coniosporium tulheliwenetii]|uniref:Uncharacterized protein n=1 Tax=Coniosporium tulheliwenetii TaxID=3383036 RepID=A0ACC2ZA28_9PEZI|nr:hypothetical protein H2199_003970 [Cladosporium sp. JES 115]